MDFASGETAAAKRGISIATGLPALGEQESSINPNCLIFRHVPARLRLRKKFGLDEGSLIITEERENGILIRPAVALSVETCTPARKAQFLLSNAVDRKDYRAARPEVKALGLDPDKISHHKPKR